MYKIAVVEDDPKEAAQLCRYLNDWSETSGVTFDIGVYPDAWSFESARSAEHDVIFLDILMPGMNGLELAGRIRKSDDSVRIIFITSMVKLVDRGYEFSADDYIIKPIRYARLKRTMDRVVRKLEKRSEKEILLRSQGRMVKLGVSQIYYVKVEAHHLLYYTDAGVIDVYGPMSDAERALSPYGFVRCNSCLLVNLKYVSAVEGRTITVGGHKLECSQRKYGSFMHELAVYLGGGDI